MGLYLVNLLADPHDSLDLCCRHFNIKLKQLRFRCLRSCPVAQAGLIQHGFVLLFQLPEC